MQKSADQVGQTAADFGQTARRLNEKDGPMDRLAEGTEALSHAADSFNSATLPRINRVTEETSRAVRQLGRAANTINDNPQSLIFGAGAVAPGPGEPGLHRARRPPMMRRAFAWGALVLAATLAGCSAIPDKPVRPTLYDFGPGAGRQPRRRPPVPVPALVLADVEATGALDGSAVLYRLGYADDHQLRPYSQARWSAPPPQLIRQRLRQRLGRDRAVLDLGESAGARARRRRGAARAAHGAGGVLAAVRVAGPRAGACCACA